MEKLVDIVKNNKATLSHICNGKVYFIVETTDHTYQLEIDSTDSDWNTTYIKSEYSAITLMRWIRRGIEENPNLFIELK